MSSCTTINISPSSSTAEFASYIVASSGYLHSHFAPVTRINDGGTSWTTIVWDHILLIESGFSQPLVVKLESKEPPNVCKHSR